MTQFGPVWISYLQPRTLVCENYKGNLCMRIVLLMEISRINKTGEVEDKSINKMI